MTLTEKQSILGYNFGKKSFFVRITVALPGLAKTARGILEKGLEIPTLPGNEIARNTYDRLFCARSAFLRYYLK